jgi:ABC-type multidrug transport system fused ATPase/permease subunit
MVTYDWQTSALDAHAQNKIFQTIDSIARGPGADGKAPKVKTVLFITHRLSVARRADKIAMMEHGVCQIISHFNHAVPMLIHVGYSARISLLPSSAPTMSS